MTFYAAALVGVVVAPIVHNYTNQGNGVHPRPVSAPPTCDRDAFGHQDFLANFEAIPEMPEMQIVVVGGDGPAGSVGFDQLPSADPIEAPLPVDPATPALVGWTSGTTANPKGVIHSHQTVCAEISQLGAAQPPARQPLLIANPISHAIGMLGARSQ